MIRSFVFCVKAKNAYCRFMEQFSILCMSFGLWLLIIAILYFTVIGVIVTFE